MILKGLSALSIDINKFKDEFDVLGNHITNAGTKYADTQKRLDKVTDKLSNIQDTKQIELK
jgi:DNA recombination protein RmuC